jgi:hypothetical protein
VGIARIKSKKERCCAVHNTLFMISCKEETGGMSKKLTEHVVPTAEIPSGFVEKGS